MGAEEVALVVDYAHTTDALGRAIDAVRPESGTDVSSSCSVAAVTVIRPSEHRWEKWPRAEQMSS